MLVYRQIEGMLILGYGCIKKYIFCIEIFLCRKEEISMKATGIVRNLDSLGRVTLPIELRRNLNIDIKDPVEIFVDGDSIVLKKYEPADIFTGNKEDLLEYQGKMISRETIKELAKLAGI
jgi:transcriptional pleiotropic regulator of transition state genes